MRFDFLDDLTEAQRARIDAIARTWENGNRRDARDTLASVDAYPAPASFGAGEALIATSAVAVFAALFEDGGADAAESFARSLLAAAIDGGRFNPPPACGHSTCRQAWIDSGDAECDGGDA